MDSSPLLRLVRTPSYTECLNKIIINLGEFNMTADKYKPGNNMAVANGDASERRGPAKEPNGTARVSIDSLLDDKEVFSVAFPSDQSLNEITRELKRFFVDAALRRSAGSRQGAARMLGISRYSLKHYMKTLGYRGE